MKKTLLVFSTAAVLALMGCSEDVAQKEVKQVETTDKTEKAEKAVPEQKKPEAPKTLDIEVANNETVTAVLKSINLVDEYGTQKYEITYEVENKSDKLILVQARNVSADGKMVPEDLLIMSDEIAPGKVADCVLKIEDYEGGPLPEMKENFEMTLLVADSETFMDIGNYEVSADIK